MREGAPRLIVFGGLPGVGKTTLSGAVAMRMGAMHMRVDVVEAALRESGSLPGGVGPAGYALASANLSLGLTVVADSVKPLGITRAAWHRAGTGYAVLDVEVTCSDRDEHRRRVEARRSDLPGLVVPDWAGVLGVTYEATGPHVLRVDTASEDVEAALDRIVRAAEEVVPA